MLLLLITYLLNLLHYNGQQKYGFTKYLIFKGNLLFQSNYYIIKKTCSLCEHIYMDIKSILK